MKNSLILEYIRATTNLYGIISLEKVVEIYNQQNEEPIDLVDLGQFKEVQGEYFEYFEGDFVHESIIFYDSPSRLKAKQGDKPYYVPSKDELLQYADSLYFERNIEYEELYDFIQRNLIHDSVKADGLTDDIQLVCAMDFSVDAAMNELNRRNVSFKSEAQVRKFVELVTNLANNTRIWDNRGHTPNEIFTEFEKPHLQPLSDVSFMRILGGPGRKIGRNDPCPCGSGKKYKKCCLGKYD